MLYCADEKWEPRDWKQAWTYMWGIDSLSRATIDIPNTQSWKARNAISSRFVFFSLRGHERVKPHYKLNEVGLTSVQAI